jgi:predicted Rossmann-fold nucleotide-binding protein
MSQTAPVIAVFGGTGTGHAIERGAGLIGSLIARRRYILLTGAVAAGEGAVNKCAIAGAENAVEGAPWVGIERSDVASRPRPGPTSASVIISPGYGHRRNFVIAQLCDAAIAFPGATGTVSEMTFCLALGRPTILVGDWNERYPIREQQSAAIAAMIKETEAGARKEAGPSPLDPLIDHALTQLEILSQAEGLTAFENRNVPQNDEEATEVLDCAIGMFTGPQKIDAGARITQPPAWLDRARSRM